MNDATAPFAPARAGYRNAVLALLVLAYTFNFIDRTIIATVGQAIKVDLKLTDAQLGLLGGLSFALLYTLLGIPIARLAERWNRVSIIAVALVIWSGFTAACGLAGSFVQLLALRVGVGFGEAGCSPPAQALISDYFEPRRRASALSVYSFGIPLGTMLGAAAGGWLAKTYGWRIAFMVVGAPGLVIAVLVKLIVREPARGAFDPPAAAAPAPTGSWWRHELMEIWAVTKTLFGRWSVLNMVFGVTLASFAAYGAGQFAPPYFNRAYGLDYATVGLIFGLVGGFSAGLGTLAGGFLTDWAGRRGAAWYSLVPAIGLAIATPLYLLAYSQPNWRSAALILLAPGIFHYMYLGPTFGVVQNMVDARRRATAAAVLLLFLNIIALGGGPVFTGWIIDRFAGAGFSAHTSLNTVQALGRLFAGAGADFAAHCPGGAAPAGSAPALAARCHIVLVRATHQGLIVTVFFYAWAALHYVLGAIGLAKDLRGAASARGGAPSPLADGAIKPGA